MRLAIIDLGTNSVRFDVHQIDQGRKITRLHREKMMIRLGQGVFLDGKLDPNAIRRTLQAFLSFKRQAEKLRVEKIIAFGTSAMREAADTEKLLGLLSRRTKIDVKVISGTEEAKLIARGILANESTPKGRFGLIDIGGGSTEISICRNQKLLHMESFPLGTARLQQVFLKKSPPRRESIQQLEQYIKSILLPKLAAEEWPKVSTLIGSSGTIRSLARMLSKNGRMKFIERKDLCSFNKELSRMNTTELLGVPGMEPKRVDMFLAGSILLEQCMHTLGAKEVHPTEYSLRDGILDEEIELHRNRESSHISFHVPELFETAIRFGAQATRLNRVALNVEIFFRRLQKIHQLEHQWEIFLLTAGLLRKSGEAISPLHYAEHSSYIVKNADLGSTAPWESDFVAELCRLHEPSKSNVRNFVFEKDREKTAAFKKLLALLRVVDALDSGQSSKAVPQKISLSRKKVILHFSRKTISELEILRLDRSKELFEEVFERELIVSI